MRKATMQLGIWRSSCPHLTRKQVWLVSKCAEKERPGYLEANPGWVFVPRGHFMYFHLGRRRSLGGARDQRMQMFLAYLRQK